MQINNLSAPNDSEIIPAIPIKIQGQEESLEIENLMLIQKNNMIRLYGQDFSEILPARRQFKESMYQIMERKKSRQ